MFPRFEIELDILGPVIKILRILKKFDEINLYKIHLTHTIVINFFILV